MASSTFRVHGLDELTRAADRVADDLPDTLKATAQTVAGEIAEQARSRAQTIGGVAAHSADAVYAEPSGDGAGVGLDGAGYPTAFGAEFGANAYPQFPSYVGPDDGYFLYPTVERAEGDVTEAFSDGLDHLLQKANLL